MKLIKRIFPLMLMAFFVMSCQKEIQESNQPLVFNSLYASSNSFQSGTSVNITADASGTNLVYHWSYNSGTLTGGGSSIVYSNEVVGYHKVICSVVDGAGEIETKEIFLTVN